MGTWESQSVRRKVDCSLKLPLSNTYRDRQWMFEYEIHCSELLNNISHQKELRTIGILVCCLQGVRHPRREIPQITRALVY